MFPEREASENGVSGDSENRGSANIVSYIKKDAYYKDPKIRYP